MCIRERAVKSGVAIALGTDREVVKRGLSRADAGSRMRRQHMLTAKCAPRGELSNEPGARRMRGRGSELGHTYCFFVLACSNSMWFVTEAVSCPRDESCGPTVKEARLANIWRNAPRAGGYNIRP